MKEHGWPIFVGRLGPNAYMVLSYVDQVNPWNSAPGASPPLEACRAKKKRTKSARCAVEEARPQGMTRQRSARS
jgi:hypothetical protein